MSLYDKSSLVLIPSGTKTGKVYSQKPVSGDGDFTFTRSSAATRVNADGFIEKETQNLLTYSNGFNSWGANNVTLASGQSGYDGSSDAYKLTPNTSNAAHRILQTFTATGNSVQTWSVYAKADGYNFIRITENAVTGDRATFNISTGSVSSSLRDIDTDIQDVGNGWYRCSLTINTGASHRFDIYVMESGSVQEPWAGDGTSGVLIQDAQAEYGLVARDVITTTTTAVEGGITDNVPRLDYTDSSCPALLLEPQRTNLLGQSEYIGGWSNTRTTDSANATISPEGVQNASLVTDDSTASSSHFVRDGQYSLTSGTTYTFSFYAKSNGRNVGFNFDTGVGAASPAIFNLSSGVVFNSGSFNTSIEDAGNGWYRCIGTFTASATASSFIYVRGADSGGLTIYNGDSISGFYIYGLQLEAGSYATSYIPTYGSSVTRNFDYSIVESLGYSSTCTFYYEFNTTTGRESSSPFAEVGKDQSNKIWIKGASANNPQFSVQGNGIFSGSISPTNEVSGTNKIAVQWSSGVGVVFSNGVKQSGTLTNSNTSENIDFISAKGQGTSHDSKQLLFFEEALSDADCITLTTI